MPTKRERISAEQAHARRKAQTAKAARQRELFKPVDVQKNLITGAEVLDPARPRTDLQAGADDPTKGSP